MFCRGRNFCSIIQIEQRGSSSNKRQNIYNLNKITWGKKDETDSNLKEMEAVYHLWGVVLVINSNRLFKLHKNICFKVVIKLNHPV